MLNKQATARENHNAAVTERTFFAVWAMNFAAKPKWLPGVLQTRLGPVSTDERVWRLHVDHLRARIPEENVGITLPLSSGVGVVPPMEGVKLAPSPVVKSPSLETVITSCTSPKVPTPTEREMTPELRRSARVSKPPIQLDLLTTCDCWFYGCTPNAVL